MLHRRGAAANARLLAEFRSVRRISHRNLVQLFEMFDDGQHACFTMELVDGQDLLSWLQSDDGDPDQVWLRKVQAALLQLLDGLEELWRCGFAHGDVKPSNVRVQSDGRAVLKYLAPYVFRVAISDNRLLECTDETVTFKRSPMAMPERSSVASCLNPRSRITPQIIWKVDDAPEPTQGERQGVSPPSLPHDRPDGQFQNTLSAVPDRGTR